MKLVPRRRRDKIELALAFLLSPVLCLVLTAALTPLPRELRPDLAEPDASTVFLDRYGAVLCEVRAKDGARARPIHLADVGDRAVHALLAAEDRRFFVHFGVDPLAIGRAVIQLVFSRKIVSGGSTLTQQLARTLVPRPRSVVGKLREMALALRIEASLSKDEILEQYLNRVAFGPSLRGIEATSRFYFDKPTKDLSLAEAAALASLPRGPTLYDPRRGTERLLRRRDRVLERMRAAGLASSDDITRALGEPLVIAPRGSGLGIPHLRLALLKGELGAAGPLAGRAVSITTTIDRGLQREVEILAAQTIERLAARQVTAAAVVVLDNPTGEVLAYVGSPDIENVARLGHNDGVLATRQPGSALKPFLYGLGMEVAGFTAATVLPDVDLHFPTADGDYHPNNYDGRFHGPVRVREALGSSFNVPAVVAASRIGPERLLGRLHDLGFSSLDRPARDYGLALALGDGEVRLIELANAYATLARQGLFMPVLAVREVKAGSSGAGESIKPPQVKPRRVLDPRAVYVVTNILADRHARLATFGENSVLELPFAVAAKTGTSKGYRDNIAVGFTPDITVAVWVGNFDGSPMSGVSGVTGAGPLFHDVMLAASRLSPPRDFERPEGLVDVEVCPLSGGKPTAACPHHRPEILPRGAPLEPCSMHERVRLDRRSGLRAGPACPDTDVDVRTFEAYPPELVSWAQNAGRPLAPRGSSPFCPVEITADPHARIRIAYPPDGARFVREEGLSATQAIRVRIDAPAGARVVRLFLDGRAMTVTPPFERSVPLVPGDHVLYAEVDGVASERVSFSVL